jgi:hypothetical protein
VLELALSVCDDRGNDDSSETLEDGGGCQPLFETSGNEPIPSAQLMEPPKLKSMPAGFMEAMIACIIEGSSNELLVAARSLELKSEAERDPGDSG